MINELLILEEVEHNDHGLTCYSDICLERLGKAMITSIRIVSILAEVANGHKPEML
jgi:hypothetical protein